MNNKEIDWRQNALLYDQIKEIIVRCEHDVAEQYPTLYKDNYEDKIKEVIENVVMLTSSEWIIIMCYDHNNTKDKLYDILQSLDHVFVIEDKEEVQEDYNNTDDIKKYLEQPLISLSSKLPNDIEEISYL